MNPKTLQVLEFGKVRQALAALTAFPPSRELALTLEPSRDLELVQRRLRGTSEAVRLLELNPSASIGGARDIREKVRAATIGSTLEPQDFLDILGTLQSGRSLCTILGKHRAHLPVLTDIVSRFMPCPRLEKEVARCINDRGEVVDEASPALGRLRRELRTTHARLLDKLNEMVTSPDLAHVLQETIVTLRGDRYVIPIKAEFKGHFRGIVHDQSASGATLFMEPLATLDLNNRWRQLQLEEREELARILRRLSALAADHSEPLLATVVALAEFDLALAKARYSGQLRGIEPKLGIREGEESPARAEKATPGPSKTSHGFPLILKNARHPLLAGEVVPISLHLGRDFLGLVITGPNTGGKTVALKTVGLLALMCQAGLHIPADEGSQLPVFRGIYADIGDEQSIEQSLSTFSAHLTNIVEILAKADGGSLVLLDELGAGTDPAEGSALAQAMLGSLLERRAMTMVATHYPELKAFAYLNPLAENASVEFDVETLSPTYRLRLGLPGQSNALSIATRLGLDPDIVARAQGLLSPSQVQVEGLLAEIRRERDQAAQDRQAAQGALGETESIKALWEQKLAQLESARDEILESARDQALAELQAFRQRLRRLAAEVEAGPSAREGLDARLRELSQLEQELKAKAIDRAAPAEPSRIRPGDAVLVKSLGQVGRVLAIGGEPEEADVQLGTFKLKTAVSDLEPTEQPAVGERIPTPAPATREAPVAPPPDLDLRGWRAEEIALALDRHLNDAYLAGLPYVRIIHGKGTGALRQAVRELLGNHPLVKSFQDAEPRQGGEGVTVVVLSE
ncbi:MAG: endonuclease MutS2 [Chloroflexi bacterium]|nr:endonuclease MutS2 [Chloroflexota bacterium]